MTIIRTTADQDYARGEPVNQIDLAWGFGFDAAVAGGARDCPYDPITNADLYAEWMSGYEDGQRGG